MSNDLATEITGRVRKVLDGLLAIRAWRRLSALPTLGQRLYTRHSNWVDGLLSRLHSPVTSALLFTRSSNLQLLPLSYTWFDRRWIDRRKQSRSFWRQSGNEKDEDRQMPAVPEYFFEEAADDDITNQLQSTQFEPAYDIMLNLLTLRTLPTGNLEFTRAGQLAKRIALRLELLTSKGSHTQWYTPFEASEVPLYPGMAANYGLLDKVQGTIAGQRLSHVEETFYPSGPVDSSPPGLHPVSEQYTGATLMPVPGKFSLAERTHIQSLHPAVPSSERMSLSFEPSGDLPVALGGQSVNEARIGSPSHLSETPSITSNNILARKVFSRLQSLFGTPLVTSSTNLMGEALADSPSSPSEPPQVAFDAVLAEKADTTPIPYPEQAPLFGSEETPDMASAAYQYLEMLAPQPPLNKTWGSRQTSPWHWSAGHIPPSLTGEGISQEMGGPVQALASTIKSNSFGGYSQGTKVGLALAPVGRQRENIPAAPSRALDAGPEGAPEAAGETMPALDPEALASEVYSILKHRLIVEKERTTSAVA